MNGLRHRVLRVTAAGALSTAAVLTVLPSVVDAQEPVMVGWWHRDIPLTDSEAETQRVTAQSSEGAVIAGIAGTGAGPSQVPPAPSPTVPPPPAPLPTVPPEVTIPDPGTPPVPTPTPTPEDGLYVANDVTGMRAMAAVRFDAPDAGGATLVLEVAPGSTPSPGVRACPALSDWQPGPDQPWSARPAHDCDRFSISGVVGEDGTTMTWSLPDTFRPADSTVYDVLLLPVDGDGTPYQVVFGEPGGDAFEATSAFPVISQPPLDPLPEGVPPPIESFNPDGFDFAPPGFAPGSVVPIDTVPSGTSVDPQPSPFERAVRALENPTTRRIATLALLVLGAYAYRLSNRTVERAPRLLGALGSGAQGTVVTLSRAHGIGRFARPRAGPPARL